MIRHIAAVILGLGITFWGAMPASAQQASSFDQLQVLVKPGDTIVVTNASGLSTKGTILSMTPSTLRVSTNKTVRDFSQRDVLTIKQRKPASLLNGALAGAAIGAGLGALSLIGCGANDSFGRGHSCGEIGMFAGLGAVIGIGIDALVTTRHTIYRSQAVAALNHLDVKPIVSSRKKGVAMMFSF